MSITSNLIDFFRGPAALLPVVRDENTFYFCTDTHEFYLGDARYTGEVDSLVQLTDVDLSELSDNDILKYNSETGKWENAANYIEKCPHVLKLASALSTTIGFLSQSTLDNLSRIESREAVTDDDIILGKTIVSDPAGTLGLVVGLSSNRVVTFSTIAIGTVTNFSYNELSNKPSIENVVLAGNKSAHELGLVVPSDLTNFVNIATDNLVNYYTKSQTYSKEQVDNIATAIRNSRFAIVDHLPTENIQTNVIYLVPKEGQVTSDIKEEYINLDGTTSGWELIGSTDVDIEGYVTEEELNTALSAYTTTVDLMSLLAAKQDVIQVTSLPTADLLNKGTILQYIGITTTTYTHGYYYECVSDGAVVPTYSWQQLDVQPNDRDASSYVFKSNVVELSKTVGGSSQSTLVNLIRVDDNSQHATVSDIKVGKTLVYDASGTIGTVTAVANNLATITTIARDTDTDTVMQWSEMPQPIPEQYQGTIVQYIGADGTYKNGYFYKCEAREGTWNWYQCDVQPNAGSSGGGHTIEDADGVPFTQRAALRFGESFNVSDDSGDDATLVEVNSLKVTDIDEIVYPLPSPAPTPSEGGGGGSVFLISYDSTKSANKSCIITGTDNRSYTGKFDENGVCQINGVISIGTLSVKADIPLVPIFSQSVQYYSLYSLDLSQNKNLTQSQAYTLATNMVNDGQVSLAGSIRHYLGPAGYFMQYSSSNDIDGLDVNSNMHDGSVTDIYLFNNELHVQHSTITTLTFSHDGIIIVGVDPGNSTSMREMIQHNASFDYLIVSANDTLELPYGTNAITNWVSYYPAVEVSD